MSKELSENEAFEVALEIAARAHKGQVDKNGIAYITHPLAVAARLESLELKTIALLHDTIEDTDVTADLYELKEKKRQIAGNCYFWTIRCS
jgi:(p)ppGpp synthase/HD superfamily hydrolase